MAILGTARFSTRPRRFWRGWSGIPHSFFSLGRPLIPSQSEVWPGSCTSRLSGASEPGRGSVRSGQGIGWGGMLTWNEGVNRSKRAGTGDRMNGFAPMRAVKWASGAAAAVLLMTSMGPTPVLADTIEAALVRAYQNNPQLNAQRAQVRSTDENVPQALSGYRPRVALTASAGFQHSDTNIPAGDSPA